MTDGNKRYLGDVLINDDNYKRQKQFFKDIIETYQYQNGGEFNAFYLQNHVPSDFATSKQGELAEKALLAPLKLGSQTELENTADPQYIYSDAIIIDKLAEQLSSVEWFEREGEQENKKYNLTDLTQIIYNAIQVTDEKNLDTVDYNNFYNTEYTPLNNLVRGAFQTVINEDGEEEQVLDASLVNGLRFILITRDAYNALPASRKNFWRNIFIFVEEIPADYHAPYELDLSDGYEFRVFNGYLQVSNILSDSWRDICSLQDLLNGANIDEIIRTFIEDRGYTINGNSLMDSLGSLDPVAIDENWNEYPFLNKGLRGRYITNITLNNSSNNVTTTTNDEGLKQVNLDVNNHITAKVNELLTPVQSDISGLQSDLLSTQGDVSDLSNNLSVLSSNINSVETKNTQQDGILSEIQNQLLVLQNSINDIYQNMMNFQNGVITWKVKRIDNLATSEGNLLSYNYYNEALKLAIFQYEFSHYFLDASWANKTNGSGEYKNTWYTPSKKNKNYNNTPWGTNKLYAIPEFDTIAINRTHPFATLMRLDTNGNITVKKETDSMSGWTHFGGSVIYKYSSFSNNI